MLKFFLFSLIISFVFIILWFFIFPHKIELPEKIGSIDEFTIFLSDLENANNEDAFLIITLKDTDDFIQLKYFESYGFEIDFPLVTPMQKENESKIREVCKNLYLPITENLGTDGSLFLDIYIQPKEVKISETVIKLFEQIYSADRKSLFKFSWVGF